MLSGSNIPPLESYWMLFTANRQFKAVPRILAGAEGYYIDIDSNRVINGTAGLWVSMPGIGRREIATAVERQLTTLDYASGFQMTHPLVHEFANRLTENPPGGKPSKLNHVFFTSSVSECADTALKIVIAWQRSIGQVTRTRVVGREKRDITVSVLAGYRLVGYSTTGGCFRRYRQAICAIHSISPQMLFPDICLSIGAELADDLWSGLSSLIAQKPSRGDDCGADGRLCRCDIAAARLSGASV